MRMFLHVHPWVLESRTKCNISAVHPQLWIRSVLWACNNIDLLVLITNIPICAICCWLHTLWEIWLHNRVSYCNNIFENGIWYVVEPDNSCLPSTCNQTEPVLSFPAVQPNRASLVLSCCTAKPVLSHSIIGHCQSFLSNTIWYYYKTHTSTIHSYLRLGGPCKNFLRFRQGYIQVHPVQ